MFKFFKSIRKRIKNRQTAQTIMSQMDIGSGTRISRTNVDGMFPLLAHIGKNCIFAPMAMILTHDASYFLYSGEYRIAPVYVGDNVFIGYGATIMPGTKIGNNVVIGAGSLVNKDIPPNTVVAGVPAKIICSISDYLDKRRGGQMFKAPFSSVSPKQISRKDVADFAQSVYQTFWIE